MRKLSVLILLSGCISPAQLDRYADQVDRHSRVSLQRCYDPPSCRKELPCLEATSKAAFVIKKANERFQQAAHYVTGSLAGRVKMNIQEVEKTCKVSK